VLDEAGRRNVAARTGGDHPGPTPRSKRLAASLGSLWSAHRTGDGRPGPMCAGLEHHVRGGRPDLVGGAAHKRRPGRWQPLSVGPPPGRRDSSRRATPSRVVNCFAHRRRPAVRRAGRSVPVPVEVRADGCPVSSMGRSSFTSSASEIERTGRTAGSGRTNPSPEDGAAGSRPVTHARGELVAIPAAVGDGQPEVTP
jgi:hypothetical protein